MQPEMHAKRNSWSETFPLLGQQNRLQSLPTRLPSSVVGMTSATDAVIPPRPVFLGVNAGTATAHAGFSFSSLLCFDLPIDIVFIWFYCVLGSNWDAFEVCMCGVVWVFALEDDGYSLSVLVLCAMKCEGCWTVGEFFLSYVGDQLEVS